MSKPIQERGYPPRNALVSTDTVAAASAADSMVRVVDCSANGSLHIPSAARLSVVNDLYLAPGSQLVDAPTFATIVGNLEISAYTLVALYSDDANFLAAHAYWVFSLFGHLQAALMDGGKTKWEKEGKPLSSDPFPFEMYGYQVTARDDAHLRATRADLETGRFQVVDTTGEGLANALSLSWRENVDPEDETFKPADELRAIYVDRLGLKPEQDIIVTSAHTWFVLKNLLGFRSVRVLDDAKVLSTIA
ncbi:MAG TPA: hypothetical protein VJB57_09585 [Dehalococcoidia bacterium]|nr:hypothetical protein [Dehalococcoidia bacterium]